MKRIASFGAFLALSLAPPAACAHAFLDHAIPAVGGAVATAPKEVRMYFTQPLEPAFSGATLRGADGRTIATGAATVDRQNPMELVIKLPPLPAGHYKVEWQVVSVDTHRTEGSFAFDVGP